MIYMENLVTLMVVNLVFLTLMTIVSLVILVMVLLMLRKTLIKVQSAVDDVQDAAMVPLTSMKHIFSDLEQFVGTFGGLLGFLSRRKTKPVHGRDKITP